MSDGLALPCADPRDKPVNPSWRQDADRSHSALPDSCHRLCVHRQQVYGGGAAEQEAAQQHDALHAAECFRSRPDTAFSALNLYSDSPDGFGPDDDPLLLLVVEHATRAITDYLLLQSADAHAGQLQEAMTTRAPIEQAKGILMAIHNCDADTAFTLLRAESQNPNTKLHTVARAFITAHTGQH